MYNNEVTKNEKDIEKKIIQLKNLMKIVEQETSMVFLFDIERIDKINTLVDLSVRVRGKALRIDEFIDKFNGTGIFKLIRLNFKDWKKSKYFPMRQFVQILSNEIPIKQNSIWSSNEFRMIDEWNRILITLLSINGYKITFTEDSLNYLKMIKHLECLRMIKEEENEQWKTSHCILSTERIRRIQKEQLQEYEMFEYPSKEFLMIETVEKDDNKITFPQTKESQLKRLISLINSETKYSIVFPSLDNIDDNEENSSDICAG